MESKRQDLGEKKKAMEKTGINGSRRAEMENRMQMRKPEERELEKEEILTGNEGWEDMPAGQSEWKGGTDILPEEDWGRKSKINTSIKKENQREKDPRTVILQVEQNSGEDEETIDLLNIAGYMKQKWRFYAYLLVIAVCIGFILAAASLGLQGLLGDKSYATAVINFSFDGIDEGKDPSGGLFDVTKLKSTAVINEALEELGWNGKNVEEIRSNIKIEGVIPDSVKQQIAVINTVAEDAAEYYATIEDLNYFPSQYTVTLQRCKGMNGNETRELLDAILIAYRKYFMDSYAGMAALGFATEVLDVKTYDYMQASDMIGNEIDMIEDYVEAKAEEAPNFRANSTGLSFGDLANSIATVRRLDLNNFISFVQTNNLTRDAGVQIDYYNYQIKQYNLELQELQTQRSNVDRTIESYEKDPVIVVSSQETVTETSQTDEYYNNLLQQKLDLNKQISEINTSLNEAYDRVNALNASEQSLKEEDYTYADTLLDNLLSTVESWGKLVQETTEEYFEAELYANAYRISIPAQYSAMGGLGELIKRMLLLGGGAALLVVVIWGVSGLKEEMVRSRRKA